ncbi:MAG: tRNA 2-thiouridine(34) synthase MnmA [Acidimicrobiales bacterium]
MDRAPVMVAMSGGVDSSAAAALLLDAGHEVVGVTMKLWGGPSDSGCCSVADVDDARWVADRLGIEHHVFNFGDDFERRVVAPYVADHRAGRTPNPCIECNRHIKFDRLLRRAEALGFSRIATGHHARVVPTAAGPRVGRGVDAAKDQAYVLHMLGPDVLGRLMLPVGELTKAEVRALAGSRGLITAAKPDSQDVCFITASAGRRSFLGERIELHPATVVDGGGEVIGEVEALELVSVGQRKGLGLAGGGQPRYVVDVDAGSATVTVGSRAELDVEVTPVEGWCWVGELVSVEVLVQTSAHGTASPAVIEPGGEPGLAVRWAGPHRRVAPGQSVVAFVDDLVVGGGIAAR